MTVLTDASLVAGSVVTPVDPATAETYAIVGQPGSVEQINPLAAVAIPDPFGGPALDRLGGVVVAISVGGLEATVTALTAQSPTASTTLNLSQQATSLLYSFEQSDGSYLSTRTVFTGGEGPTLQEVLNGTYDFGDMLAATDTMNGAPYTPPVDLSGDNDLLGTFGDDALSGEGGDDTIDGGFAGNDTLDGGPGNDSLTTFLGDDLLLGGDGDDILADAGGTNNTLRGGDGMDTLNSAGELDGGRHADLIRAGYADNMIYGRGGYDTILGGSLNDTVKGGTWNDLILGNDGNDSLMGNRHNDTLDGGHGDDYLNGGGDNDVLMGFNGNDTMHGGDGADKFLFDFTPAAFTDIIDDFAVEEDLLIVSGNLADGMTRREIFETASVTAAGVELSFNGQTIILEGLTSTNGLQSAIRVSDQDYFDFYPYEILT
ncbi:calcium-binding protein [Tropicibacter naphthalenivorans]|uniref:Cyclolysin n=1 Tax=Tropicibacter naphthalenivorans TaxID=441103 RepID=A0A0P1G4G9_9RHOB|nr:calcium-binding protein [Tropicibacter naphthalenivorans]CUH76584.1 Cyclolysin [Tropicibacter naphthalenivorans]SMC64911.1 Hemolysin-type calcium-binding repeat-containing protein [Tropicibacter naphthalenivorans]